jgi:hypothetical protein
MELFKSDRLLVEGFNENEILGMGGPFVCNLKINGTELEGSFLCEKPALSEAGNFLGLVKYYEGPWRLNCVFTIYIIDFNTGYILESYSRYLYLFVDSIKGFEITFYESFHNKLPDRKRKIELSEENFKKIGEILIKIDNS